MNVPITNNKLMTVEVALNTTGKHTINVTATGKHGNTTPLPLGEFWIDAVIPSLTINRDYNGKVGDNKALYGDNNALSKAEFGGMKGTITCKKGSTVITNANEIKVAGTYSIKCTATGNNGKSSGEKTITLTLNPKTFTEIMTPLLGTSVLNNDPDHNLRYVGSNPNNYINFNNELWRIIGVFGGQAKIIRNNVYRKQIEFDKNEANGGHGEFGNSDWNISTTQQELNITFLNQISTGSKEMIDQTYSWSLGGPATIDQTRSEFYQSERSSEHILTSPTWKGAIGLLYPSDYGYATSSTNNICTSTQMSTWNSGDANLYCAGNDYNWLRDTSVYQWTITPQINGSTYRNFYLNINGFVWSREAYDMGNGNFGVKPALYLKTNVEIHGGTGASGDPYILGT